MGDVVEMILEGLLCDECGVVMDDHDAPGYPRKCNDCKPKSGRNVKKSKVKRKI